MFNILYRCPRTVARHENGPLHESRLLYLEHLSAQGAAVHTLKSRSRDHLSGHNLDEPGRVQPSRTQKCRACRKTMGSSLVSATAPTSCAPPYGLRFSEAA
jgi:hypothetical protein